VQKKAFQKAVIQLLTSSDLYDNFKLSNDPRYDFEKRIGNTTYVFKLVTIEENAEVTINSPVAWEMHFGGGEYFGKPYKNCRFLKNVVPFLNWDTESSKVVIFSPEAKRILKWVNESEMIFVTPSMKINGIYVLNLDQLTDFLEKR
jgi:hypothetical protein